VIDDDAEVLDTTRGILEDLGYKVEVAQTAEDAFAAFERGAIDLAIVDLSIPGFPGIELGARLRERKAALPILFSSGYPDLIATNSKQMSADAFLGKPYSSRELATKLEALLQTNGSSASTGERALSPASSSFCGAACSIGGES
jgi:DNA-binding response OmpR family regulator